MSETQPDLREALARAIFERGRKQGGIDPETWEVAGDEMQAWLLGHADAMIAGPFAPILAQVSALQAEVERLQKVEGEREKGRVPDGTGLSPDGQTASRSDPSDFDPSRASEALARLRIIADRGAEINHLNFRNEAGEWVAASVWIDIAIDMLSQACQLLPDLKEERDFWRADLSARLWMLTALHQSASERGEHRKAADLGVHIRSGIASYEAAEAKEWHPRCDVCGGFVRPNEASISGEEISGHARCVAEESMGSLWPHGEGELARRVRLAKAIADAPDEDPPAPCDRSGEADETRRGSAEGESTVTGAARQAPSDPMQEVVAEIVERAGRDPAQAFLRETIARRDAERQAPSDNPLTETKEGSEHV